MKKMKEQEVMNLLPYVQRYGVLFICSIFGLLARESYDCLKNENYQFKKAIPKMILGFFVCIVTLPFLENIETIKKTFPIPALLISFMYMSIANFISTDLLPFFINKYAKKGIEKND
jgi:hypothetical protein